MKISQLGTKLRASFLSENASRLFSEVLPCLQVFEYSKKGRIAAFDHHIIAWGDFEVDVDGVVILSPAICQLLTKTQRGEKVNKSLPEIASLISQALKDTQEYKERLALREVAQGLDYEE